jgi:type 1 glutamine amidotransferase
VAAAFAAVLVAGIGGPARPAAQGQPDACGGRSNEPQVPCAQDVTRMMATLALVPDKPPATPAKPRKVLVLGKSAGFVHSSIPLAARMIEEMGKKTGAWTTAISYDPAVITKENLAQYDAIFLASTTGTFLDDPNDQAATDARRQAFLEFVRSGKGVAGIHAASDSYHGNPGRGGRGPGGGAPPAAGAAGAPPTVTPPATPPPAGGGAGAAAAGAPPAAGAPGRQGGGRGPMPCTSSNTTPGGGGGQPLWPDFNKMIGGYFKFHWNYPTPITVKIDDPKSPITAAFKGKSFNTIDEVYTFNDASFSRENVHVLTSIDYSLMTDCDKGLESSPRPDKDHGLSWIRREGNGRVFYEALGHHETIYYNNPAMLEHILAGMQYALGDLKADDSPSKKAKNKK